MRNLFLCLLTISCLRAGQRACDTAESAIRQAERALSAGKADEAESILQPLQLRSGKCPAILLLSGQVKDAQGLPSLARDLLTSYTIAVPVDAKGLVALARIMWKQRDATSALDTLQSALKVDRRNIEALLLRSDIYESKRETALAEADLLSVVDFAPSNSQVNFKLGSFYDRHHEAERASIAFQRVTLIDPANAIAWDYLALNLEARGLSAQAETAYQSGLRVNRGSHSDRFLEYNFARFLVKQNRLGESKPLLDRAVEGAPDTRAVYYERAKLRLLLRDLPGSKADVETALLLRDPARYVQDVQLYALAASVSARLGETNKARRYAELARMTRLQGDDRGRQ